MDLRCGKIKFVLLKCRFSVNGNMIFSSKWRTGVRWREKEEGCAVPKIPFLLICSAKYPCCTTWRRGLQAHFNDATAPNFFQIPSFH